MSKMNMIRVFIGVGCVGASSLGSANLLLNAGFEGAGLPNWSNWGTISSYMNVYNNTGANGFSEPSFNGNFTGVVAQEGEQFVAGLSGPNGTGFISQTFAAPLEAGTRYNVSGWLHQAIRTDLNHPSSFAVLLMVSTGDFTGFFNAGTFDPTVSTTEGWVFRSLEFVAPTNAASYHAITFITSIVPGQGNAYTGLDNVALEAVPEPVSATVLAVGSMMLLRRRKASRGN